MSTLQFCSSVRPQNRPTKLSVASETKTTEKMIALIIADVLIQFYAKSNIMSRYFFHLCAQFCFLCDAIVAIKGQNHDYFFYVLQPHIFTVLCVFDPCNYYIFRFFTGIMKIFALLLLVLAMLANCSQSFFFGRSSCSDCPTFLSCFFCGRTL